ncbi:hypothetical protein GCM10027073_44370 [Streptomyces chlorus]|uniref:Uncharacterized protein n=1 Tax=Streptomyces chlorus TaxID=887452 RepID=A0ABW1DY46_9ACTN
MLPAAEPHHSHLRRRLFERHSIRRELQRIHLGTFTGPAGTFQQVTALTKPQRDLLAKLQIPAPKQVVSLQPASR